MLRLADIDTRIVVSGTRGKSSTTRRLYDVLAARGYDIGAKISGNHPVFLHDGETYEIERGSRVTLYENERELRDHTPTTRSSSRTRRSPTGRNAPARP